jgi:hypothetical protein
MAPLAGKPPFATDEPDSYYESQPPTLRKARPPPPPNPNARTSAYNVYVYLFCPPAVAYHPSVMTIISLPETKGTPKEIASLVSAPSEWDF